MKVLQGYAWNKSFGPYSLPVKFQNQLCKLYSNQNSYIYAPAQGEPIISSVFQLKSMLNEIKKNEEIVMLSMYMLPKVKNERKKIYNIVLKKKTKLHFVIENKIFSGTGSETEFENYFNYLNFIKDSNFLFKLLKKKK